MNLFALLQQKIYERNYELGEIFAQEIRFVSFIDHTLTWESSASGENRERLKLAILLLKTLFWKFLESKHKSNPLAIQTKTYPPLRSKFRRYKKRKLKTLLLCLWILWI